MRFSSCWRFTEELMYRRKSKTVFFSKPSSAHWSITFILFIPQWAWEWTFIVWGFPPRLMKHFPYSVIKVHLQSENKGALYSSDLYLQAYWSRCGEDSLDLAHSGDRDMGSIIFFCGASVSVDFPTHTHTPGQMCDTDLWWGPFTCVPFKLHSIWTFFKSWIFSKTFIFTCLLFNTTFILNTLHS